MDSLLASYGSSDEEEDLQQQPQPVQEQHEETSFPSRKISTFPSLPPPKSSSSLFFSLPPPKSEFSSQPQTLTNFSSQTLNDKHDDEEEEEEEEQQQQREEDAKFASKSSKQSSSAVIFSGPGKSSSLPASLPQPKSSSIFSFLPPPKTNSSDSQAPTDLSSSLSNTKRVVQFKLPINPYLIKSGDHDDEDDDDNERKESKVSREFTQTSSVKSFLSSIPAPRNSATLGVLPSSSGSGRRSIVEADVPKEKYDSLSAENEASVDPYVKNYEAQWVDGSSSTSFGTADGSSEYAVGGEASNLVSARENYVNYGGYGGYGDYGNYGQYESNGLDGSAISSAPDVSGIAEHVMRVPGKRGRNEIPQEIVEVRQDELMKNRPREDQARLTGIAFGPSYQPVSTKGKPTKLHKRKHQIGSLYYDMKQKEMELAERRAKGFLTKAETQAKYGW